MILTHSWDRARSAGKSAVESRKNRKGEENNWKRREQISDGRKQGKESKEKQMMMELCSQGAMLPKHI